MAVGSKEKTKASEAVQTPRPPALRLRGVRKSYGSVVAVAGVDLTVEEGEFFDGRSFEDFCPLCEVGPFHRRGGPLA